MPVASPMNPGLLGAALSVAVLFFGYITLRKKPKPPKPNHSHCPFFNLGTSGLASTSPEGGWLEVNDQLCDLLGYDREELLELACADLIPESERDKEKTARERMIAGETDGMSLETRFIKKEGGDVPVLLTAQNVLQPNGETDHIVLRIDDITSAVGAENELKKLQAAQAETASANKRLETVLDSLDALVYVADLKTHELLFLNQFGRENFGDVMGQPCWKALQSDQTGECSFCTNDRLVDDLGFPTGTVGKEQQNTKTGQWFSVLARAVPWVDGRMVRLGVATDISDRKQMEEANIALEEQLRHTQKMESVGALAGGVAHDFNNMMMAVLTNVHLLEREVGKYPKAAPLLQEIEDATRRGKALTESMLAFSRKGSITPQPLELNGALDVLHKLLRPLMGERIRLEILPAADPLWVMADESQILQVLMNLGSNARDAMPDGGRLSIRIDRTENPAGETQAEIVVEDDGVGMDEETAQRAFDPFFTTKQVGDGTGLGLSMSYGIVQQHGGTIQLNSTPGKGTRFDILLPLATQTAAAPVKPMPAAIRTNCDGAILLAEDEELVREPLVEYLTLCGFDVTDAKDGEEAVALFQKQPDRFDLVLLDLMMPHLGGREAYDRINAIRPNVQVIFISGYPRDAEEADGAGDPLPPEVPFITKPVMPDELLSQINRLIELRKSSG